MGGKQQNQRLFSPHPREAWGEKRVIFPPTAEGCGGKILVLSPHVGGKTWEFLIEFSPLMGGKQTYFRKVVKKHSKNKGKH